MGLGKTVISLELICSDVNQIPEACGGTLVVLPVSLLAQWEEEIKSKTPHLKAFAYHGSNVQEFHSKLGHVEELSKYDIVLTTMIKLKELTSDRTNARGQLKNCLAKIKWHRFVVDECQFLKNDTTAIARAASAISATHIWMLSGTPLTNKLDDLRGELSLLRVWPFTLGTSSDNEWRDHFWSEYIKKSWDSRSGQSLPIIHKLMQAVSMRHSRLQIRSDGSPLVELPPRTETFVAVTMDSTSSYAYVNRWVEVAAAKLLHGFNRFDVRVAGMIIKLQLLASSPARLLDRTSLEQMDGVLSKLASFTVAASGGASIDLHIRKVALRTAIIERKQDRDSPVLQELILLAANGPGCLTPCTFCKKSRSKPAYLRCTHSLCVGCCMTLLATSGVFACPVCSSQVYACDINEVLVPAQSSSVDASENATRPNRVVEVDLDEAEIDRVLVDQALQLSNAPELEATSASSMSSDSSLPLTTYNVVHQGEQVDFQRSTNAQTMSTFESLKSHPQPLLSIQCDLQAREEVGSLANGKDLQTLFRHAYTCKATPYASPKIKALCDTVQGIRDSSLEAKICIFSTFARVLDDVEEALDNVRYNVEYDMNTKMHLLPGQSVRVLGSSQGHVIRRAADEDQPEMPSSGRDMIYEVRKSSGSIVMAHRNDLQVDPVAATNVPSKRVRKSTSDEKVSVNGSSDRHAVGSAVESKRRIVSSTELQVGYAVTILPDDIIAGSQPESGRVVFVHRKEQGCVSHDILPNGLRPVGDGAFVRKDVLRHLPPSRLQDKGGNNWTRAKITGVSTKHKLNDSLLTHEDASSTDPFEHALGYVRLDGSAGSASRRGEILETFKRDPMTSICLLTKQAAGVGLNLTDANHVIVLEPSMDAHDELQSIARVHRIGQTRKVSVLKFYMTGSIEERILKRRQQRGELNVSINSTTGGTATTEQDEGTVGKGDKDAEVLSSRAMTLDDLKLLLGVGYTSIETI